MLNQSFIHIKQVDIKGFNEIKITYLTNHTDYLQEHQVHYDLNVHNVDHSRYTAMNDWLGQLTVHSLCMLDLIPVPTVVEYFELLDDPDLSDYLDKPYQPMSVYERKVDTSSITRIQFSDAQDSTRITVERQCAGQLYNVTLPPVALEELPVRGAFRYPMQLHLTEILRKLDAVIAGIVQDNINLKYRQLSLFEDGAYNDAKTALLQGIKSGNMKISVV